MLIRKWKIKVIILRVNYRIGKQKKAGGRPIYWKIERNLVLECGRVKESKGRVWL